MLYFSSQSALAQCARLVTLRGRKCRPPRRKMALNSGSAGAISARLSQHPAQLTTPRIQVLEKERQRTAALRWAESEHPVPVHGSLAYEEVIAFADMSLYSHPNHLDGAYWKANGWAAVIQGVGNAAVDCRAALSYGEGGLRFARFCEVRRRCASLTVRTSQSPWRRTSPILGTQPLGTVTSRP